MCPCWKRLKKEREDLQMEKDKKQRTAVYRRVSTGKEPFALLVGADERRINSDGSKLYVGSYIDQVGCRNSFKRLMEAAGEGEIDRIETRSISDFANNIGELLSTACRLRCLNKPVEIHFEEEDITSGTDEWEHCVCFLMGCLKSMYRKPRITSEGRILRIG